MTTRLSTTAPGVRRPSDTTRTAGTVQRLPVDLVRVLLGLAITGVGVLIAQHGQVSSFERDLFRIVNDLPPIIYPVVWLVMQLGNVVSVAVLAAVAAATAVSTATPTTLPSCMTSHTTG